MSMEQFDGPLDGHVMECRDKLTTGRQEDRQMALADDRDQTVNRDRKMVEMDDRQEIQENRRDYHRHQIQTR